MRNDLLLVIDMQNVYTAGGHWECVGTEEAAMRIKGLLDEEIAGLETAFTRFDAPEAPVGAWTDYNEVNAEVNSDEEACAMMPVFAEYLDRYPCFSKSIYSAMEVPELIEMAHRADCVAVCGVVAECCVLSTVMALIDMGCRVVYLTDAVAGESEATMKAVETALAGLEPLHIRRMTVSDYARELRGEN